MPSGTPAESDLTAFAESTWIVNSRNTADETAVRTLGSLAGFTPTIAHQIDSLDLVEDLCETIVLVNDGRVVLDGPQHERFEDTLP